MLKENVIPPRNKPPLPDAQKQSIKDRLNRMFDDMHKEKTEFEERKRKKLIGFKEFKKPI